MRYKWTRRGLGPMFHAIKTPHRAGLPVVSNNSGNSFGELDAALVERSKAGWL